MTAHYPRRTDRLVLRPLREDDVDTVVEYRNDPAVAEFQDWDLPVSREQVHREVASQAGWTDIVPGEPLNIAVEHDGELVGDLYVGLDVHGGVAEIGFTLRPLHQRRGYAFEAASALVSDLIERLDCHRIVAQLSPKNTRSAHLLERLGMHVESLAPKSYWCRGAWDDNLTYAMSDEDWYAARRLSTTREDAADFYTGSVPDVYSALRGSRFDPGRYRDFLQEHGTPGLELGCGDDGPFFDLVAEGYDLDGVDSSADMVRRARERLAADGTAAAVHRQRMEDLDLERRYRSVYLAGPTFNLLPDDAAALRALQSIAAHLEPGGAALVPLWVPPPTPRSDFGQTWSSMLGDAEARYTVLHEEYDVQARTRTSRVRYELVDAEVTTLDRDWVVHWHTEESFHALAARAGLSVRLTPIGQDQWEATLRHAEP